MGVIHRTPQAVKVCVVTGQAIQRDAEVQFLQDNGYQVSCFSGAEELLNLPTPEWPDLFLINLRESDEAGFSMVRSIRKQKVHAAVLLIIGARDVKSRSQAFLSGADNFLIRPYVSKEVLVVLQSLRRRLTYGVRDATFAAARLNPAA